jgi:alpha-galactosidase/6-phospho-beta-glucosidase family protein
VKVTFIGAGSTVFARTLIGDLVSFPDLVGGLTIGLMDIDEERLLVFERMAFSLAADVRTELVDALLEAHGDLVPTLAYGVTARR